MAEVAGVDGVAEAPGADGVSRLAGVGEFAESAGIPEVGGGVAGVGDELTDTTIPLRNLEQQLAQDCALKSGFGLGGRLTAVLSLPVCNPFQFAVKSRKVISDLFKERLEDLFLELVEDPFVELLEDLF